MVCADGGVDACDGVALVGEQGDVAQCGRWRVGQHGVGELCVYVPAVGEHPGHGRYQWSRGRSWRRGMS